MKKLMIVMTMAFMTLCGIRPEVSAKFVAVVEEQETYSDQLIELSTELSLMMTRGEFEGITDNLSDSIKEQLNLNDLEIAWDQVVGEIGEFIEVYDVEFKKANVYDQVFVKLKYEQTGLRISYMYDENAEIASMWLDYFTIPSELAEDDTLEEVEITIGEHGLGGILTLPKGELNSVAIFVHGSGQHDMDETIGAAGNKPFRDIARGLAAEGIASIRYNKRYYQYPELMMLDLTIQNEVLDDVKGAIEFAATDERIAGQDIIIIGHSLGGMLAPKIAQDNTEVNAVVIMAGSPRGLEDIMLDQNMDVIMSMEFETDEEKNAIIDMVTAEIDRIKNIADEGPEAEVFGVGADYWQSLNEIDTPEICEELDIPFLIMQGNEDFQVYIDKDYEEWKNVFEDRKNATFMLYDGLNHLFMPAGGARDLSEYDDENYVASEVISDMVEWIKQLADKK